MDVSGPYTNRRADEVVRERTTAVAVQRRRRRVVRAAADCGAQLRRCRSARDATARGVRKLALQRERRAIKRAEEFAVDRANVASLKRQQRARDTTVAVDVDDPCTASRRTDEAETAREVHERTTTAAVQRGQLSAREVAARRARKAALQRERRAKKRAEASAEELAAERANVAALKRQQRAAKKAQCDPTVDNPCSPNGGANEADVARKVHERTAPVAVQRRRKVTADCTVQLGEWHSTGKTATSAAGTSSLLAYLQDHIYAQPSSPALSKNGLPVSSPAADDGLEARSVGTQIYPIRCFKSTQTSEASRLMLLLDREATPLAGLFAGRVKHESVSMPNGQPASSTADASIEARSVGTQIYPLRCSKSTQTSEASRLMLLLDRENPQHVLWSQREPLLESCGHNAGSS